MVAPSGHVRWWEQNNKIRGWSGINNIRGSILTLEPIPLPTGIAPRQSSGSGKKGFVWLRVAGHHAGSLSCRKWVISRRISSPAPAASYVAVGLERRVPERRGKNRRRCGRIRDGGERQREKRCGVVFLGGKGSGKHWWLYPAFSGRNASQLSRARAGCERSAAKRCSGGSAPRREILGNESWVPPSVRRPVAHGSKLTYGGVLSSTGWIFGARHLFVG